MRSSGGQQTRRFFIMAYTYANLETIKLYVDYRQLVQLTNDDDLVDPKSPGSINETVLQAIENEAAQTIDNYLIGCYTVPLTGTDLTPEIKRICAHLTHIGLQYRRGAVPEETAIREDRIRARLKMMASQNSDENRKNRLETSQPTLEQASGYAFSRSIEDSGLTDVLDDLGARTSRNTL